MPEGPRWVGDNKPDLTRELEHAQALPPQVTDQYVFFFGYEGHHPEVCFQQWYPYPFSDPDSADESTGEPLNFHTAEQYMMYWKVSPMGYPFQYVLLRVIQGSSYGRRLNSGEDSCHKGTRRGQSFG